MCSASTIEVEEKLWELIQSNLKEIVRCNNGTYSAYIAELTLNKMNEVKL